MKHNPKVVEAFFKSHGIPKYETEFKFHPERKWRFDYAWFDEVAELECFLPKVALEVEGGVWTGGRHTSGSGFVKDMEKYNAAAMAGWRIIRCQPKDLLTHATAQMILKALGV